MTPQHTPEPWRLQAGRISTTYTEGQGDETIVGWKRGLEQETKWSMSKRGVANARRIIACVNALAGIENPEAVGELITALREHELCCLPDQPWLSSALAALEGE